jgi:intracellular sulfur oxidation DsrE/DsrF family protein
MNTRNSFSDEQLQAFVDDEIDVAERAEIMEAVRHDEELACRVCELLQIKDSVRLAYREPELPANRPASWKSGWWNGTPFRAAAAVLIFALGTLTGTSLQTQTKDPLSHTGSNLANAAIASQELKRVVLHISTAESQRLDKALSDAEELLSSYKDHPEMVQLEVVANAEGLSLLRADTSPYPERIKRLAQQFNNVSFLACSRAIEKLRMRGIDVHLLPEARVIPGALEEIVDRLQEGWLYIRV